MNVVMYRVPELDKESPSGRERNDWERQWCQKIFNVLEIDMAEEDIKFCRRIGERGREPRPLVVGFYAERDRNVLLRRARNLEKTEHRDIQISQDLTKRQREEEGDLRKEAEKRNEQLTEDERSKNVIWAVVGARGEKRLVKTTARDQYQSQQLTRGRGRGRPASGRGRNTVNPPRQHTASRQEEEMETMVRGGTRRPRSEDGDEEEMARPGKR